MSDRWCVRNVDADALDLLRKVRERRGVSTGVLLSRAIRVWHSTLTETGVERQEPHEIGPMVSCEVAYPTSLSDLLRQFSSGM